MLDVSRACNVSTSRGDDTSVEEVIQYEVEGLHSRPQMTIFLKSQGVTSDATTLEEVLMVIRKEMLQN